MDNRIDIAVDANGKELEVAQADQARHVQHALGQLYHVSALRVVEIAAQQSPELDFSDFEQSPERKNGKRGLSVAASCM